MLRAFALIAAVLLCPTASLAERTSPAPLEWVDPSLVQSLAPDPSESCCRVCHKGKACGDSCISRKKRCHKPPGCACDG